MRRRSWTPFAQLAGSALTCWMLASPSQALGQQPACRVPDFPAPEMCARAGLDTVRADYLLFVDESGSMTARWRDVQQALAALASSIPDGDVLDVRLFSGGVRSLIAPTPATAETRAAWAARFRALPSPAGTSTDLGRAAEAAAAEIASAPSNRVQFIFFVTDGRQQAEAGSPFGEEWSAGWEAIAKKASISIRERPVSVTVIRLAEDADRSFLTRVFLNAVVTDAIGADALRAWFAKELRGAWVRKLNILVGRELARPAGIDSSTSWLRTSSNREAEHTVHASAGRRIVQTVLIDSALVPVGGGRSLALSQSAIAGAPNATIRVRDSAYAAWTPPGIYRKTIKGTLPARTRLEPAAELSRIGIDPGPRQDSVRYHLMLAGGGALGAALYYPLAAVLLVVALWIVLLLKWRMHRPVLTGNIVRRVGPTGPAETTKLTDKKLKEYAVVDENGGEVCVLQARSQRGKSVVYVIPRAPDLMLDKKRLANEARLGTRALLRTRDVEVTYSAR
jgi:hypothetical protein